MKSPKKGQTNLEGRWNGLHFSQRQNDDGKPFKTYRQLTPTNKARASSSPAPRQTPTPLHSPHSKSNSKSKSNKAKQRLSRPTNQRNNEQKLPGKKVEEMLKNLFQKHELMKKNIERLRQEKQAKQRQELQLCTFVPEINKSPRFKPQGTFQQRQKARFELREHSLLNLKQEVAEQRDRECRFRPVLVSRQKSVQLLSLRETKKREKLQQELKGEQAQAKQERLAAGKSPGQADRKDCAKRPPFNWPAIRYAVKLELNSLEL